MTGVHDDTDLARELIDAVSIVMGSVPGHRVTHTKGVVLRGTFTATPRARELTRAAHMQGDPVPVTVRFSNGAGDPRCPDAAQNDPRGMAVKFYLPDGSRTDLVCQSWPVFPAGTPEGFLGLMRAQGAGPVAIERFLASNPDIAAALEKIAALGDPPLAWGTMAFNSLVAYRLVAADGSGRHVRFRCEPEAGVAALPAEQQGGADNDYLMTGVLEQVPVRHRVLAQLAAGGDQTTDSSQEWPADREWVDLGVVEVTGPDTERERDGDVLVYDPMRVTDGIEPSDDPILHLRPLLYAESVRRRTAAR
ncbi:catalase family peroxidase [Actinomycetospora sp. C-140]